MSFWRRHKRKILAAAAVGAAGAAAAYYWWFSNEEEERQRRQARILESYGFIHGGGRRQAAAASAAAAAAAAAAAEGGDALAAAPAASSSSDGGGGGSSVLDDSLQQHFISIQELSDRQALEELLPRLHDMLLQATNYEPLREQLRSSGFTLSSEEKLNLWRGLASHSFTRALGAVWLVPLLDLLVRLKLHIVGRHMYLESKLPQLTPQAQLLGAAGPHAPALGGLGGGPLRHSPGGLMMGPGGAAGGAFAPYARMALPPCLSDRAKEEFFRCDFFIDIGAGGLLAKLRAAVERALAGLDFGGSMTHQDVESLVIAIHASFEEAFVRAEDEWAAYLLPPGPAPVSIRTGSGVEAVLSPVEAAMVDELNRELCEAMRDFRFVEALRGAVRHTSKGMGAYICSKMGGSSHHHQHHHHQQHHQGAAAAAPDSPAAAAAGDGSSSDSGSRQQQLQEGAAAGGAARPFPYVVPIVAKSGQLLFDETDRCTKGISSLHEVQALCAYVFTFGPYIC